MIYSSLDGLKAGIQKKKPTLILALSTKRLELPKMDNYNFLIKNLFRLKSQELKQSELWEIELSATDNMVKLQKSKALLNLKLWSSLK